MVVFVGTSTSEIVVDTPPNRIPRLVWDEILLLITLLTLFEHFTTLCLRTHARSVVVFNENMFSCRVLTNTQ